MSIHMSILDFTTGLFRDPANLRAFVDDPDQALFDAGLPDVTPEQVHDLLPVVAESMPPDHPLQTVIHAADPVAALQAIDIDELAADAHHHHHEVQFVEKVLADVQCKPDAYDEDPIVEPLKSAAWDSGTENDKGLGDVVDNPLTPEIEGPPVEPADDYGDRPADGELGDDHALDDGGVDLDMSAVAWGKAIE